MGFGKWLKGATRIRFDDRTLGNLLKNTAVGAGTLVGGPLGLAIGAGGSALGQAALPGANAGDIFGAGLKGAGTTGGLQAAKGAIGGALNSGAPALSSSALPEAATDVVSHGGLPMPSVPNLVTSAAQPQGPGLLRSALDAGKGAAEWAGKHDKTSAAVLSGLGDAMDGSDTRLRNAQAAALERQNNESEYEYQQRKARDLALEPIRQALYGNLGGMIGGNNAGVAANPYAGAGQ